MKPVLLYGDGTALNENYHNFGAAPEKLPFFLIPDSNTVFVKVIPVSKSDEKTFRKSFFPLVKTYYPGSMEEILFDSIVWRKKRIRTAAVYILKKEELLPHRSNQMFRGITFPIQLIGKKEFKRFSRLVFLLPDIIEIWHVKNKIPVLVQRENKDTFTFERLGDLKNQMLVIGPAEKNSVVPDNAVYRTFTEAANSLRIKPRVFKNNQCGGKVQRTPFLVIVIFIFSLLLVFFSLSELQRIKNETGKSATLKKMILKKEALSVKKVERIKELEKLLIEKSGSNPVNVYLLLLRLKRIADTGTKIDSIKWTQSTLTISCRSAVTLTALKILKDEFGVIQVSKIRPVSGGKEAFSVTMEGQK